MSQSEWSSTWTWYEGEWLEGNPPLLGSLPSLSRILSVIMLILGIVAVGVLFYKVMAGFFVIADPGVGHGRQVWAVLFDSAQRLDEDRSLGDQLGDVGGTEFVEPTGRWDAIGDGRHRATLRARCPSARECRR